MAIPIKKEPEELYLETKVYEHCFFCEDTTDMWHEKTNNPVCPSCAKVHKVSDLPNRFKGEARKY